MATMVKIPAKNIQLRRAAEKTQSSKEPLEIKKLDNLKMVSLEVTVVEDGDIEGKTEEAAKKVAGGEVENQDCDVFLQPWEFSLVPGGRESGAINKSNLHRA